MPSSASASACALQQIRFLIVRGPISIGENKVGNCVLINHPKYISHFSNSPHPVPLPIRWGEGGRRPGEGISKDSFWSSHLIIQQIVMREVAHKFFSHLIRCFVGRF